MRITESKLRSIISEEARRVLSESYMDKPHWHVHGPGDYNPPEGDDEGDPYVSFNTVDGGLELTDWSDELSDSDADRLQAAIDDHDGDAVEDIMNEAGIMRIFVDNHDTELDDLLTML